MLRLSGAACIAAALRYNARRQPSRPMISMPQALREYVFTGCESSITFSQMPSGLAARDWIVITGQAGGRQVQLAIMKKEGLPDVSQALVGTGVTLVLAAQKST
jgi:hypothetical protein